MIRKILHIKQEILSCVSTEETSLGVHYNPGWYRAR